MEGQSGIWTCAVSCRRQYILKTRTSCIHKRKSNAVIVISVNGLPYKYPQAGKGYIKEGYQSRPESVTTHSFLSSKLSSLCLKLFWLWRLWFLHYHHQPPTSPMTTRSSPASFSTNGNYLFGRPQNFPFCFLLHQKYRGLFVLVRVFSSNALFNLHIISLKAFNLITYMWSNC